MSANLLDPKVNGRYPFKYRDSGHTNLRARFRLERIRLRKQVNVVQLKRKAAK